MEDDDRKELRALAQQHYDEAEGDWDRACSGMQSALRKGSALYRRWVASLVALAIRDLIRDVASKDRRRIASAPNPDAGAEFMERAIRDAERSLLDYPLRGGVPLRNADRALLDIESEFRRQIARTNNFEAAWLEEIRAGLPEEKVVQDVYDDSKLRALREKVKRAA